MHLACLLSFCCFMPLAIQLLREFNLASLKGLHYFSFGALGIGSSSTQVRARSQSAPACARMMSNGASADHSAIESAGPWRRGTTAATATKPDTAAAASSLTPSFRYFWSSSRRRFIILPAFRPTCRGPRIPSNQTRLNEPARDQVRLRAASMAPSMSPVVRAWPRFPSCWAAVPSNPGSARSARA